MASPRKNSVKNIVTEPILTPMERIKKSREKLDMQIEATISGSLESANSHVAKYHESFAKNPLYAIEWYTDDFSRATYTIDMLGNVIESVKNNDFTYRQFVEHIVKRAKDSFANGMWYARSTSVMANSLNTWKHQVYTEMIKDFDRFIKLFKELDEEEESIELPV